MIRGDASEVYQLAADLSQVGARAVPALRSAMDEGGRAFADTWRTNAVATSGEHGRHYPNSIDSELVFSVASVAVDVGPNTAKKQGGMGKGFEFGSKNQPPHLDGVRAMEAVAPAVEALVDSVIAGTFSATPVANPSALKSYTTKAGSTRMATQAQIDNWTRGSRS